MSNQYQKFIYTATFLFFILALSPFIALADESPEALQQNQNDETTEEAELPVLPEVTVTSTRIAPMTGATIIDRDLIENLPARNGTLNEIISIVPGVQYSEYSADSFTGGEITPPNVSISGGRFYENNFSIDGFSNNSALEPGTSATNNINVLPGHPQQIFLDPHLIDQITVYDSNVPAEHGGFTGGMVDAETLDPVDEFWVNINYRHTRDSWAEFHIDPSDQDAFENSETAARQPEFRKHDGGLSINTPIGNDMGVLLSYQRLESEIPLLYSDGKKDQTRRSENFFLKYGYHISNKSRLYFTGIYAPNKNEYFSTAINDDYTIESSTSSLTSKFEHDFAIGTWDINLGYSYQETERDASLNRFRWALSDSIDSDSRNEGGYGPLETDQEDFELVTSFDFQEGATGNLLHKIKIGLEIEHSKQTFHRPTTSYNYTYFTNYRIYDSDGNLVPVSEYNVVTDPPTPISCNGAVACIENEQYLPIRYVYEAGSSEASYNRYSGFLQDALSWYRLELFPGVRVSHDSYTENTNVAPRFSASYDLFGNRKSIFFGGANRYYSQNLLTHKLREARSPSNLFEYRSAPDQEFGAPPYVNDILYPGQLWKATDLETPYSDEITLGFIQSFLGGTFKAQYINRKGRDELATERTDVQSDGYIYNVFNNNGRSEHESYQASWHRTWRLHYLEINGTYQDTNSSNFLYSNTVDTEDTREVIIYNGRILYYDELPRSEFNRPSVINFIYSGELPFFNTRFTNTTKYRHSYHRLKFTGFEDLNGENVRTYEKDKNKSTLTFDWRFAWNIPIKRTGSALLTLDIYNVFNEKGRVKHYNDQFEIGRQFWAGVEMNF